jgi:rubrerythrin
MKYYVYAYLRKDGTPYYIGKGSGNRAWSKGKGEVGKPTDLKRIIIVEGNLTLTGSFSIERRLIRWYGRIDLGTGILRNQTDGGDGGKGVSKGNKLSEETKIKISKAHLGKKRPGMSEESKKKLSESLKGKNLGKKRSIETKKKLSNALKGKTRSPLSEETKQKLKECNLGKIVGPMNEEHKRKISNALKGRKRSKEHSENLSRSLKGRIPSDRERERYLKAMEAGKSTCPYCGKTITKGNYNRWHGPNCKLAVNTDRG